MVLADGTTACASIDAVAAEKCKAVTGEAAAKTAQNAIQGKIVFKFSVFSKTQTLKGMEG